MTTITQAITTMPDAPDPLTPATFEPKAAASVLAQKAMVKELQTWTGQVNTVAGEVNANALAAAAQVPLAKAQADIATEQAGIAASQATAAAESAETALNAPVAVAISNYAGRWELLTGPLSAPSSVYYGSAFWVLIEDVADITASVPGTTSAWVPATSPAVVSVVAMSKTTDYTIDAGDRGSRMSLSGSTSRTFTLPPAATAGDGWFCYVANAGDDTAEAANPVTLTIDGNGSETIEGVTTITEYRGGVLMLITDGASWFAERIAGGLARFTQSGTFVWPVKAIASGEIIGAGGGGAGVAGGSSGGGGGGGGAMRPVGPVSNAVNTADTITVGASGTGGVSGGAAATVGGYSRWLGLYAYGGGQGQNGGSTVGGGGGGWNAVGNAGNGGGYYAIGASSTIGGQAVSYTVNAWGHVGAGSPAGPGQAGCAEWGGGAGASSYGAPPFCDGGGSLLGAPGGGAHCNGTAGPGGGWGSFATGTGGAPGVVGSPPTPGTNGTSRSYGCGDGGGAGGYSSNSTAGGKGGDGGSPGGGGGSGGASASGNGGNGGKGGRGEVRIWYN